MKIQPVKILILGECHVATDQTDTHVKLDEDTVKALKDLVIKSSVSEWQEEVTLHLNVTFKLLCVLVQPFVGLSRVSSNALLHLSSNFLFRELHHYDYIIIQWLHIHSVLFILMY